tara:strand:- start:67501 stop:69192 length:1692 start_codon:yes stop_codon:yes gene_type:complete
MKKLLLLSILFLSAAYSQTDTMTLVSYNLLNFPEGRDDCGTNTVVQNREDTLRKIMSYTKPDVFVACEVQNQSALSLILNNSLTFSGAPNYAAAGYSSDGSLNNVMFYNADKLTLYDQGEIIAYPREIDHYLLYFNDPNLGTYFDTTFVHVYMSHLKAGNSSSNEQIRATQTEALMDYIETQPTSHNHFFCGDLNVYSSNEDGYQNLITGPFAFEDPINAPGNWNNNGSFDYLHTQSTRTSLNFDCGSKGGLDDRFDQILVSQNVMSGSDSVRYLSGSYDAVGNDGNHFNSNLLQGNNTDYPDSIVSALYYMSDHLPVLLKAVATYPTSNGLALFPSSTSVSCYGDADGTATITPNAGQAPYDYLWGNSTGNQTTQTATGLSSGQHCVLVTDDLGQTDSYCVYVPGPDPIGFNYFTQPDEGTCDGAIYFLVEGGVPPYWFDWNGGSVSDSASAEGLCGGTYLITITDDSGCDTTVTVELGDVSVDQNVLLSSVSLYPNPATDVLNVQSNNSIEQWHVVDQLGRRIELESKRLNSRRIELEISVLPKGIYFVRIGEETLRFIKE